MSDVSLSIQFNTDSSKEEPITALLLEQVPFEDSKGGVTKASLVALMRASLYRIPAPQLSCSLDPNGDCVIEINAYPYYADLDYIIDVTHGLLSERIIEEIQFTETVSLSIADEVNLKYPAQSIVDVSFVGDAYDNLGNIVQLPSINVAGTDIKLSSKIYGSLKVTYEVIKHSYTATLTPRSDATANAFSSVVYARYNGGIVWKELDIPSTAEIQTQSELPCGYGGSDSSVEELPNDYVPKAHPVYRVVTLDYCSQEVTNDATY